MCLLLFRWLIINHWTMFSKVKSSCAEEWSLNIKYWCCCNPIVVNFPIGNIFLCSCFEWCRMEFCKYFVILNPHWYSHRTLFGAIHLDTNTGFVRFILLFWASPENEIWFWFVCYRLPCPSNSSRPR